MTTITTTTNPNTISIDISIAAYVQVAIAEHIKLAGQWEVSTDLSTGQLHPLVQGRYGVSIVKSLDCGNGDFYVVLSFHDDFAKLCVNYGFGQNMSLNVRKATENLSVDVLRLCTLPGRFNHTQQEQEAFSSALAGKQRAADMGFMPVRAATRLHITA